MDYTMMTEPKKKKGKKKQHKDKPTVVSWHEFGKEEVVSDNLPTAPSDSPPPYQRPLASQREAFQARSQPRVLETPRQISKADESSDWRSTMEPTTRPEMRDRPKTAPTSERALDQDWRIGTEVTHAPDRIERKTESNWRMGAHPTIAPTKPTKPKPTRDYNRRWKRLS